jgi:Zn-dependent M28 family amino/carboxypeptidase
VKKSSRTVQAFFLFILFGPIVLAYMCVNMPGETISSGLSPLTEAQIELSSRLEQHVMKLAGEIGERNYGVSEAYNNAANFIAETLQESGFVPYEEELGDTLQYRNIVAEHYGTSLPEEVIIVGAHYDTVWLSSGADDNASGVAVMLEIARLLKTKQLDRTIRFVAFANEEYPHFLTDNMGSLFHAKRSYEREDKIIAMLSLEMLGYFSDEVDSQSYPSPLSWFYPNKANFIAFVSDFSSRNLLKNSISIFRDAMTFPSEGLTAPVALIPDVRRSDQSAFWRYNYPAFMVTDTAAYRYNAYHNAKDVPDRLDYDSMARVTTGLIAVLEELAGNER